MGRKQRIVVIGGGFGGAFSAKYLKRKLKDRVEVELINQTNYFVFQPLLPEVAAGIIGAADAVTPLRVMLPGVKFRMAEVFAVDFTNRTVRLLQGSRRIPVDIDYDHLVLAPGQQTNDSLLPGLAEHGIGMRNLADAYRLRNQVIQCLEHADVTNDPVLKRRLLTFVVAGGGFSGVETIGEVVEMIRRTLKFYPRIDRDQVRMVLLQREDTILPELPASLAAYAQRKLEKRGIEIRTAASLSAVTATSVELEGGESIPASTLVNTIGNGPGELVRSLGIELQRGKIPTDRQLRVPGQQQVWALGDTAAIPLDNQAQQFAPPTAQFASQEAALIASNIAAALDQRPLGKFAYKSRGALASIGHYSAVAELFGVKLSGLLAWFAWRGFYIMRLPGLATKLRVTLNWIFDYVLPRSIVQIRNELAPATHFACFKQGEILFQPGQLVDGFYTVVEGTLESRIADPMAGEDFVRTLGPGDHWGERALRGDVETKGSLIATDDCRVMILSRADFQALRDTLPVVDQYFSSIAEETYASPLREHAELAELSDQPTG